MNFMHRPGADEYPRSFAEYVECIGAHEDIPDVLTAQLKQVVSRLKAVDESRGDYRYAPGKWTIKEIIGHLCDTERVFAYRALRIGRGDVTPLPSFDDQSYIAELRADDRTLASMAAEWGAVRSATTTLFQYLPAPA